MDENQKAVNENLTQKQILANRTVLENPPSLAPATGEQLKKTEEKIEDRMSVFERATIRLTRIGVFVGILTLIIFAGQLYEMWQGGRQTDKLITASNTNARAATSFANSASNINGGIRAAVSKMQGAVDQLGSQVKELKKSAKESDRLAIATEKTAQAAKDGIVTNRNAIQLENRAWLGVTNETVVQFETGKPTKVDITLINTGKTPASHVMEGADVQPYTLIPDTPLLFGLTPTASIPPQGSHILHITSNAKLDGITKAKIEGKVLVLVFRGTVQYEDFNKIQRTTSVCMFMSDPATKQLSFCETGNDMD